MAKHTIESGYTNLIKQLPETIAKLEGKITAHENLVNKDDLRHDVERMDEETGEMVTTNEINTKEFNAYVTLQKLNLEYYAQIERLYAKQMELLKGYNNIHKAETSANPTTSNVVLTDELKEELVKAMRKK